MIDGLLMLYISIDTCWQESCQCYFFWKWLIQQISKFIIMIIFPKFGAAVAQIMSFWRTSQLDTVYDIREQE